MGKEITKKDKRIITNGGPLTSDENALQSYKAACNWETSANSERGQHEPLWSWDCGYKLDFDGPIVDVSSRFYPPSKYYGSGWDGRVTLRIGDRKKCRHFETETLEELKTEVEEYVSNLQKRFLKIFFENTCQEKRGSR